MSKIISANKQIAAARVSVAFLGHTAKQINHIFIYAVWVAVAVISGKSFVRQTLFILRCVPAHYMFSVLSAAGNSECKAISVLVISPLAIHSSNPLFDKMSGLGPV